MRITAWIASSVYASRVSGKRRYVAIRIGAPMRIGKISSHHVVRSYGAMPVITSPSAIAIRRTRGRRSEEHTSELQSQSNLVCRLLLEKKKKKNTPMRTHYTSSHTQRD